MIPRGFTLTETLLVLVLAGVMAAAAITMTSRGAVPGSESAARAALWQSYQAQVSASLVSGSAASATELSLVDPAGTYVEGPLTPGDTQVSVHAEMGRAVHAALSPDGTCWLLRYDMRPSGDRHAAWGFLEEAEEGGCDPSSDHLWRALEGSEGPAPSFQAPRDIGSWTAQAEAGP